MASASLTDEDGVYLHESVVCSHHIYKRVWSPIIISLIGEVLSELGIVMCSSTGAVFSFTEPSYTVTENVTAAVVVVELGVANLGCDVYVYVHTETFSVIHTFDPATGKSVVTASNHCLFSMLSLSNLCSKLC